MTLFERILREGGDMKNPLYIDELSKDEASDYIRRGMRAFNDDTKAATPIPVDQIVSFQQEVYKSKVKEYIDEYEEYGEFCDPIAVVPHGDQFYVTDGNHRAVAAKKCGADEILAKVG